MRCKKKANYIFQGFMAVLIFCFVLYQDKMKATEYAFSNNHLSNYFSFYLLITPKGSQKSFDFRGECLPTRQPQKDFSLTLTSFCRLAISTSFGKT